MSKPSKGSPHVCEVCGEPATCFTCDTVELPASSRKDGGLWRQIAVYETHVYCQAHYKRPVQYDAFGRKIGPPTFEFERKHWSTHG
jgi:hypothetical protein